jgi:hypothetical protein
MKSRKRKIIFGTGPVKNSSLTRFLFVADSLLGPYVAEETNIGAGDNPPRITIKKQKPGIREVRFTLI